jgi:hypothetical protein
MVEAQALHCPECGFVNSLGSSYCVKCGAYLAEQRSVGGTTESFVLEGVVAGLPDQSSSGGERFATLVVRMGGRNIGESFVIDDDFASIGRRPESTVFLDDVTVSRDHAVIVRRNGTYYLDDGGSLNGTYVNRVRIDSQRLEHGDEVQIGKYRLTFLEATK